MLIWGYLRHFVNLRIIYSLLPFSLGFGTPNQFATVGPYELNWETEQYKCWISHAVTLVLLAVLQSVNLFWFYLILKILVRYFRTGEEKDERSDDEAEEEEEEVQGHEKTNGHAIEGAGKPDVLLTGQSVMHESDSKVQEQTASLRKR